MQNEFLFPDVALLIPVPRTPSSFTCTSFHTKTSLVPSLAARGPERAPGLNSANPATQTRGLNPRVLPAPEHESKETAANPLLYQGTTSAAGGIMPNKLRLRVSWARNVKGHGFSRAKKESARSTFLVRSGAPGGVAARWGRDRRRNRGPRHAPFGVMRWGSAAAPEADWRYFCVSNLTIPKALNDPSLREGQLSPV